MATTRGRILVGWSGGRMTQDMHVRPERLVHVDNAILAFRHRRRTIQASEKPTASHPLSKTHVDSNDQHQDIGHQTRTAFPTHDNAGAYRD